MNASMFLALTTTVYLLVAVVSVATRRTDSYSHVTHTISELAEYGSTWSVPMSYGVFLPVALALVAVALLAASSCPPIALLAVSIATGYGVAAFFPCDPGSPMIGSFRQVVHNLGGAAQYIGGGFSLLLISESAGIVFRAGGLSVAAAAILLSFESPLRGLVQRIAELCLFLGLLAALGMERTG